MSANDKGFTRRLFTALVLIATLLLNVAPVQAAVTANVYIDWGQTQRTITNELYGIGLYGGVAPSIATQPTYKSNLSYFKPGVVRFHYAGMTNSSATDIRGWVDEANRTWDVARITQVMDAIDSLNTSSYGNYRPAKLVNIPDFPSWMQRVSYTVGGETIQLLAPSEYDNYAAFCAQLVTILKNQGRNVKYYTPTNERDDIYYVKWKNAGQPDKLDELITIYNKAAVAMKAADPSIKVGGLEFARGDLTTQVQRFVQGAKPNIDFVAYHFYANGNPYDSADSVYNRTMDAQRHGLDIVNIVNQEGLNVPVFDTEFNINYNGQQDFKQTLSEGAVYDALIFTSAIDNGEPATMGWNDRDGYYGKLNNNDGGNDIRMGAHNLQMFNNYMVGDRVTSTSDNGAIVTLAVKTGSRKSIALINRSGSSQTVKLNFAPAWSTASSFSRYVAAPAPAYYYSSSVSYADATGAGVTVEPNSVTVLTVNDSQAVTSNSAELPRGGWTASASNANGNDPVGNALDNNGGSRWATGAPQQSGQWFQVDLGSSQTFDKITLDAGGSTDDYPRRYEIYASDDPNNLGSPLVTGAGIAVNGSTYGTGGGTRGTPTTIYMAPQTKRYIRVVQKGSDGYYWWGINEFRVYNHGSTGGGGTAVITKVRYYPRSGLASRMIGGKFQGSNTSSTSGFVDLATITTTPPDNQWSEQTVSTSTTYRYLRYLSPNGGYGNAVEVEFYSGGTKRTGAVFGTAGSWNNGGNTFDKALDGNTATYFDAASADGNYMGIDIGSQGGGGATTFLSDLAWVSATTGWQTVQKDKNVGGGGLVLNGVSYAKGIGTNANSEIIYNLNSQYSTFSANVGIDDTIGNSGHGSVVFQVWLEGTKVYDSGTMYYDTATKTVNLNVVGKNQLKLVVTDAVSWDGSWDDAADWADARLTN